MRNIENILFDIELWNGKEITYEPLNGGLSNVTYKVFADGTPYVLRINGTQNDFLGLNRKEEIEAIKKAHTLGIGAEVFYGDNEILITEFKSGMLLTKDELHNPLYIQKVADVLRTAHTITNVNRQCSPFDLVGKYLAGARKLGAKLPVGLDDFLREMEAIERRSFRNSTITKGYCHNDAYRINILNTDGELCLIDWELSGAGNIFFDFATVSFINGYTEEEDRLLLERYFGRYEDEFAEMLHDMKYMNMLREIGWALLHSVMEEHHINHEFNYYESAIWFSNRLKDGHVSLQY